MVKPFPKKKGSTAVAGDISEAKSPRKLKLPINKKVLLIVGALILAGGVYYFLPQTQARRIAGQLRPALEELKDSLSGVDDELGGLFTLISGEGAPQSQTSFPNLLNLLNLTQRLLDGPEGQVAGESAKFAFYDLLYQLREYTHLVTGSSSGVQDSGWGYRSGVAGARVTQAEDETTTELQQVMTQAQTCGSLIDASRGKLGSLSSAMPSRFPSALTDTGDSLSSLVQDGGDYLSEADKTAYYYEIITDVQIELVPATISVINLVLDLYKASDPTIYLEKINDLIAMISSLYLKVEALSDSLPTGMEKLHADNLAVFDLFTELLTETKGAVTEGDFYRFDNAVAMFDADLGVLATRAKTYELSFWQTTNLFKDYRSLSSRCDQLESDLTF